LQWFNSSNTPLSGGTGLIDFNGTPNAWVKISNNLTAPAGAVDARVVFRFVTGAIAGGHGEVLIDDIALDSGALTGGPETVQVLPVTPNPVAAISWPTRAGTFYQPSASTDLKTWNDIPPLITGDGGTRSITVPMNQPASFFRVAIPTEPEVESGIVALYNSNTPLEPETTIHTPTALITRVGDRARDRHAREGMFSAYDHYLTWYWEERTIDLEITDRVAKGGTSITFDYKTLTPLGQPEFRAFYRGIGTVAEYHFNLLAPLVGPNHYRATLSSKLPENRPLQLGDRM